jgi:hypothetical protein
VDEYKDVIFEKRKKLASLGMKAMFRKTPKELKKLPVKLF